MNEQEEEQHAGSGGTNRQQQGALSKLTTVPPSTQPVEPTIPVSTQFPAAAPTTTAPTTAVRVANESSSSPPLDLSYANESSLLHGLLDIIQTNTNATRTSQPKSWMPQSQVHKCANVQAPVFTSQVGEDRKMLSWFNGLCNGTYLEAGALDGVRYSNTLLFHRSQLAWKGLLVELGLGLWRNLRKNRKGELAIVRAAICQVPQTVHYFERRAVGGIWEFTVDQYRNKWWPGVTINDTYPIQCQPLGTIISTHLGDPFFFDFLSLDIQGAELEAMLSLNFTKVAFGVIVVEAEHHYPLKNKAMKELLETNGYVFFLDEAPNYWFVNEDFASIYKHVL